MFNLTLRKKIFLSYLVLFFAFMLLIVPFTDNLVKRIIVNSMDDQASELIAKIYKAPNHEALVRYLKGQKPVFFFRVGIITDEKKVLYDSHTKRVLGAEFSQEFVVQHPEVMEAFETGSGYNEEYSDILEQKFAYYAKAFDFHGKTYVLRTAFPFQYVQKLLNDFQVGFLLLSSVGLLSFSILTWYAIHRLTRPIEQIITAIKPYDEGFTKTIPEIVIHTTNPNDEFGRLAHTLNSLSSRIKRQISNLVDERQEKEAILESLVEGVIAVDKDMNVTFVNHMALQLLDFDKDELLGSNFKVANQPECEELLLSCHDAEEPKITSVQLGEGAHTVYLDLIAMPIKGKHGMVLVLQDKTTQYKISQMRKDFVANASHELKTPITIIMGFAETLHDAPEMPKDKVMNITGKIVANAERMNNVIQDLLILSDIENLPSSRLTEVDLHERAQHCRETLLTVFKDATVVIEKEMDDDPVMIADQYLMELAINNLFNNAAKYTDGPAEIAVTIKRDKGHLIFSVSDKGLGIPEADLEFLFQRFYTVNKAHSRKMGGSGLGLSIVSTIVEKHFGEISVESEGSGKGTTFTLRLPIERP
ncbi:MAG: Sensor histidine kinase ResE [Chlamydiae bacterium]|nr:Sensor histidine kinase ResE [Chlamydiota bacterium]